MTATEEVSIDYSAIEKKLAELWRSEKDTEGAVTRAALWNVVTHTFNPRDHSFASETLARASESVPQRAIVIRADLHGPSEIASWISANCHRVGAEKQVCSEEVAIVAGGNRVRHIPPLVNALLIPDMPVAVWWVGDLPNEEHAYVETLLDPADRLIVDSSHFDSVADLVWLREIAERTFTAPADLNWVRLEDWRLATASLFDPPSMRERLQKIRKLRIVAIGGAKKLFGDSIESLYYAAWLKAQGAAVSDYEFSLRKDEENGALDQVHMAFDDGSEASITRDPKHGVVIATVDGIAQKVDCVTRVLGRGTHELIVRQLKRPEADKVFVKLLPIATELASRVA
ncbi:MAG TPA: glucose-6-phosphate dehydrogenase assembly protein OpcA [Thermoanaerobaculia bacterium]|nr:glucose-6-phosphate dehydrogenase assembly protein OpcA [Thermoanaerobaculia bacterium]